MSPMKVTGIQIYFHGFHTFKIIIIKLLGTEFLFIMLVKVEVKFQSWIQNPPVTEPDLTRSP
jgi:hypothetical protein